MLARSIIALFIGMSISVGVSMWLSMSMEVKYTPNMQIVYCEDAEGDMQAFEIDIPEEVDIEGYTSDYCARVY